jgi:LAO/AO transport system kinase
MEPAYDPRVPPYAFGRGGGDECAQEAEPSGCLLAVSKKTDREVQQACSSALYYEPVREGPDGTAFAHPPVKGVEQGDSSECLEVICFQGGAGLFRQNRGTKRSRILDTKELAARLAKGDRRAVAQAITLVENGGAGTKGLLKAIGPELGNAFVLGVTGPPGTGKSSLVDRLTESYRKKGLKVGIVAIDPTSPLTGGALLGDRVRMLDHTLDQGVFIRSMASRGWAGGLSCAVTDVIRLLDAARMDVIIVETVGVGQSDTDVVRVAHAVMVVLMPGLGDDVQASKAGLMEVGDVYVVNKSDLPGADEMVVNLLAMARDSKGRDPSVLKVSATKGEGVDSAVGVLERLRSRFLESNSELGEEIRLRSIRGMITELARRRVLVDLEGRTDSKVEALAEEVMKRKLTVDEAADSLLGGKERRRGSRGRRAR